MNLFQECIEALQPLVKILPLNQRSYYSKLISEYFPIQPNGSIEWEKVSKKFEIFDHNDVLPYLKNGLKAFDETVFIVWDGAHLPVIQTNISKAIEKIDDVTAVGFDTWIISLQNRYIIEFYHEGDITLGFF